jgi:predicted  nucleic acid-binding Zn-ribbon protein
MEVNLQEELSLLIELQDIDDQLQDLELERGDLPQEVSRLTGQVKELEEFLTEKEADKGRIQSEIRTVQNNVELSKARLLKYQNQLYSVTTNREYDAITQQTDACKAEITEGENRILELMTSADHISNLLEEKSQALEKFKTDLADKSAELEQKMRETEDEELELRHEREKIVVRIKKPIYAHYERIRLAKDGKGVARIIGGACAGCSIMVPPQKIVEVRNMEDFILCENCGRILVSDDL